MQEAMQEGGRQDPGGNADEGQPKYDRWIANRPVRYFDDPSH
jgi:hypothetical protein